MSSLMLGLQGTKSILDWMKITSYKFVRKLKRKILKRYPKSSAECIFQIRRVSLNPKLSVETGSFLGSSRDLTSMNLRRILPWMTAIMKRWNWETGCLILNFFSPISYIIIIILGCSLHFQYVENSSRMEIRNFVSLKIIIIARFPLHVLYLRTVQNIQRRHGMKCWFFKIFWKCNPYSPPALRAFEKNGMKFNCLMILFLPKRRIHFFGKLYTKNFWCKDFSGNMRYTKESVNYIYF